MSTKNVNPKQSSNLLKGNPNWKPGSPSPNPAGRPKTAFISEYLRERLANGDAEKLGAEWIKLGLKAKHPSVRHAAINTIADRVEGKAKQSIDVSGSIDDGTAKRIAELFTRLNTPLTT